MAEGSELDIERVNLGDIEPPGLQTRIAWRAVKEGLQEIFISNVDNKGTSAVVVIPHRMQATFVCQKCMKSAIVKYYAADVLRGYIAPTRRCECGGIMNRRFLGAERDVPVEMDKKSSKPVGLEEYVNEDELVDDDGDEH